MVRKAIEIVNAARQVSRPAASEFISEIFEDFIELHGDRYFADDQSVVGGIASLEGKPVTVIGIEKGHTIEENIRRNFGSPNPEGYRKALRLMKQAEKFHRPVILFVNTPGAYCGLGAEERGEGEAIARNLMEMSGLKTPILSVFIGEGGSGGALAFALADEVWMLENGMYAVLSPEGFASILWRDASRADEAAELMKLTAKDLYQNKVVDRIIPEAPEGIHVNLSYTTDVLRAGFIEKLKELSALSVEELLQKRYERFRQYGEYEED